MTPQYGLVGPIARARGSSYDVRKAFPYAGYDTFDFDVPTRDNGDVYDRYLVRVAEMRESMRICRQALERITPTGIYDSTTTASCRRRRTRSTREMEALIQHFLIYSQGFTVPAGECVRADRRPARRARLLHRLRRHEPARARQLAAAVVLRVPGDAAAWSSAA